MNNIIGRTANYAMGRETLLQFCKRVGISYDSVYGLIKRRKYSKEEAIKRVLLAKEHPEKKIVYREQHLVGNRPLKDLCYENNISYSLLVKKMSNYGLSATEAFNRQMKLKEEAKIRRHDRESSNVIRSDRNTELSLDISVSINNICRMLRFLEPGSLDYNNSCMTLNWLKHKLAKLTREAA